MQWEWYTNANTKSLFIHCLLRANWKPGTWQGIHYEAGDFITSLPSLADETGLSIQQVRTALKHLISTGEITSCSTDKVTGKKLTKNRIITVNNWNEYQQNNSQNNRQNNRDSTGIAKEQQAKSDVFSQKSKNLTGKITDSSTGKKNDKTRIIATNNRIENEYATGTLTDIPTVSQQATNSQSNSRYKKYKNNKKDKEVYTPPAEEEEIWYSADELWGRKDE